MTIQLPTSGFKTPSPSKLSRPFWEAARNGRLAIQHCQDCGAWVHYPSFVCDRCLSTNLAFEEVAGTGVVETFSTVFRGFSPDFSGDVPYTVAFVRLDEGVGLLTWLTDIEPDAATIGMAVEVVFERTSDEIALHRFRPRGS